MSNSVICSEREFLVARNKMCNYADFLTRKFGEFSRILSWIQSSALEDDLISAELTRLVDEMKPTLEALNQVINSELKGLINSELTNIAQADDFRYNSSLLDEIYTILSVF